MLSLIEFILAIAILFVGFVAWQAHRNHTTLKAQVAADTAVVEADITAAHRKLNALELELKIKIAALEHKTPTVTASASGVMQPVSASQIAGSVPPSTIMQPVSASQIAGSVPPSTTTG